MKLKKRKKILKARGTYSPSSVPPPNPVDMLLNSLRVEYAANGNAGHDCCKGIVPSASGKDLEIHYAYQMPMRKPEWIFINPQTDFEEVHA